MKTARLEAFSDGVIAIIITIMVLELKVPEGETLHALGGMWPKFFSYVLSFIYVGIYWNNHHHLMTATDRINGSILWANLHLLFWLSLIPVATGWAGESDFAAAPTSLYGLTLLMAATAYWILQKVIIIEHGRDSALGRALDRDIKGNSSLVIYAAAIGLAFVKPWIACGLYVLVALIWLVPDQRIERLLKKSARD